MQPRSKVLGMLRQTDHPTLVCSSTNIFGGVLEEGDYVLFYPHWYRATIQGSLERRKNSDPGPEGAKNHHR